MTMQECYSRMGADYDAVLRRLEKEERILRFLRRFPEDGSYDALCAAVAGGSADAVFQAAHALKGVCMSLGLTKLQQSAGALAEEARAGKSILEIKPLFEQVSEDYKRVIESIRELLKSEDGEIHGNGASDQTKYEYDTLMNMLQVSVSKHLLDESYTLVWANDFYYELIGYEKDEYEAIYKNKPNLYYMNDELGIHDDAAWKQIGDQVAKTLSAGENGYSLTARMRRKNGDYIWVRITSRFTDECICGKRVSYTVMTDISDAMNMRMEQSVTYDNLPGFVAKLRISRDFDLKLLEANGRFYEFFGDPESRNLENPVFRMNQERSLPILKDHRKEIERGEPLHFTIQMCGRSGIEAWMQVNASCIGYQDGEPVYMAIYIDITNETELRRMQKQLEVQADKLRSALQAAEAANRAKSDFLSRMSHDIRTPLNVVLGMKDIATAHLDDREKVKDCLKKIGLSGQHLLSLINDVLDMSKIESGEMSLREETVSLPDVMENIVTIMQPQFKAKDQQFSIRLQCVIHEQLLSDALRMRQIFLNILSNACKFTPMGGKITLDVREDSCENGIARLVFTIADTGIGMQPEFLSRLYDAFSREQDSRVDKIEGTGLGMAITKKIVDLMGGSIDVKSVPGSGTTFVIALPIKTLDISFEEVKLPDLHILVVDDDAILCEHTVELLRQLGVYADWASSGTQAVGKVKAALQENQMYDAVLLDWKMPEQGGLETTCQLRTLCGDRLPILMISAYDWNEVEEEARNAGVTGFIQKPIFMSTLIHGLKCYVLSEDPSSEQQNMNEQDDFAGRRFLLVEDNMFNQEIAEELLTDMGAAVDIAGNGQKGVEVFSRSPVGYYDVILMDIQMPVMNGYDATRAIRALDRADAGTIPILAMTADAFAEDIQAAGEAGMNGHMAKPLDRAMIKREISGCL